MNARITGSLVLAGGLVVFALCLGGVVSLLRMLPPPWLLLFLLCILFGVLTVFGLVTGLGEEVYEALSTRWKKWRRGG